MIIRECMVNVTGVPARYAGKCPVTKVISCWFSFSLNITHVCTVRPIMSVFEEFYCILCCQMSLLIGVVITVIIFIFYKES